MAVERVWTDRKIENILGNLLRTGVGLDEEAVQAALQVMRQDAQVALRAPLWGDPARAHPGDCSVTGTTLLQRPVPIRRVHVVN